MIYEDVGIKNVYCEERRGLLSVCFENKGVNVIIGYGERDHPTFPVLQVRKEGKLFNQY